MFESLISSTQQISIAQHIVLSASSGWRYFNGALLVMVLNTTPVPAGTGAMSISNNTNFACASNPVEVLDEIPDKAGVLVARIESFRSRFNSDDFVDPGFTDDDLISEATLLIAQLFDRPFPHISASEDSELGFGWRFERLGLQAVFQPDGYLTWILVSDGDVRPGGDLNLRDSGWIPEFLSKFDQLRRL